MRDLTFNLDVLKSLNACYSWLIYQNTLSLSDDHFVSSQVLLTGLFRETPRKNRQPHANNDAIVLSASKRNLFFICKYVEMNYPKLCDQCHINIWVDFVDSQSI
jgi:hypothetical protein